MRKEELLEMRLQCFLISPAEPEYLLAEEWRGLKPYEFAKALRDEFAKRLMGVSDKQLKEKGFRIEKIRLEDVARQAASEDELKYEDLSEEDRSTYNEIGSCRRCSCLAFRINRGAWVEFDRTFKRAFSLINWRDENAMEFWDRMRYVERFIRKLPSGQRAQKKVALENKYKGLIPPAICSLQACRFCWRLVPAPPDWGDVYCDEHSFTDLIGEHRDEEYISGESYCKSKKAVYNRKKRLIKSLAVYKFVDVDHMALTLYQRLSGNGWGVLESGANYSELIKNYDDIKFILRKYKEESEYPEVSLLLQCLPMVSQFMEEKNLDVSSLFELGELLNITSIKSNDLTHFDRDFNDHREVIDYFAKLKMDKDLESVDDVSSLKNFLGYSESDSRSFEELHRSSITIDFFYKCFASAEAWLLLDSACRHGGQRENAGRKGKNDETNPS